MARKRKKKKKSTPVALLEYAAVLPIVLLVQTLPIRVSYAIARALGSLAYWVDRRHRRVALENLEHAFGDELSPRERRRLAKRVFQHFMMVAVEVVKSRQFLTPDRVDRYVAVENRELVEKAAAMGRGVIFVTGHFGNWEVLGQLMGLYGHPLYTLARPLDNPYLDRLVMSVRQRFGQRILPRHGAMREMANALREEKFLAFLIDQNERRRPVFVEFFDRPAATSRSVAALALRTCAPIVFGYCVREGPSFRFRARAVEMILPEPTGDRDADILRITQQLTTALERAIRQHPEQWLWLHRRWKTQPNNR